MGVGGRGGVVGLTMSAISTVSTTPVISLLPASRTLWCSTSTLLNSKPLSHIRSPANPGAPDGAIYGCEPNGVPCVIAESTEPPSEYVGARV